MARPLAGLLLFILLIGCSFQPADASEPVAEPMPPKAAELIGLLKDPDVRRWLEQQQSGGPSQAGQSDLVRAGSSLSAILDARAMVIRGHVAELIEALPNLPNALQSVALIVAEDARAWGAGRLALQVIVILAVGFVAEWLFKHATGIERRRSTAFKIETVRDRLRVTGAHLLSRLGSVVVFALASGGALLMFVWPPVIRSIVLEYLIAAVLLRIALVVTDLLFVPASQPGAGLLRILPMSNGEARFWSIRCAALAAWFAVGFATVDLLDGLGLSPPHRRLIAYLLGLGLLAIALDIVWRYPRAAGASSRRRPERWLLTGYFLLLWGSWLFFALNLFWFGLIGGALILLLRLLHRAVPQLLRPPSAGPTEPWQPTMAALCIERGLRASLLIGAVLFLARKWQIDFFALTTGDAWFSRMARGLLGAIVIALLANFAWDLVKTAIDRKLAQPATLGPSDAPDARRRARLLTLLPILRTITLITLVAVAAMMALASLGIEIGPLIAGAGVVGLAIGFGAQTLVRDVISGMFYLLDDAFRIGEYIESGNYKGTVESFSLRTVKLRHHRGPLYTVPFGVLGAVKNMSRDWVIDKLTVSIDYGADLDKAKKLIKEIGKQLVADPEFGPKILEPLKMQGIEQFADYGIQIRMKMTTRPGEQFTIRRHAYKLIKAAFDKSGIKFSVPTVQVAGEAPVSAAAARRVLEKLQNA